MLISVIQAGVGYAVVIMSFPVALINSYLLPVVLVVVRRPKVDDEDRDAADDHANDGDPQRSLAQLACSHSV